MDAETVQGGPSSQRVGLDWGGGRSLVRQSSGKWPATPVLLCHGQRHVRRSFARPPCDLSCGHGLALWAAGVRGLM